VVDSDGVHAVLDATDGLPINTTTSCKFGLRQKASTPSRTQILCNKHAPFECCRICWNCHNLPRDLRVSECLAELLDDPVDARCQRSDVSRVYRREHCDAQLVASQLPVRLGVDDAVGA